MKTDCVFNIDIDKTTIKGRRLSTSDETEQTSSNDWQEQENIELKHSVSKRQRIGNYNVHSFLIQ